tara:strand:+ start:1214 stop:1387 length:174 start_codon:yes stop_codon:yes gene_type:complete
MKKITIVARLLNENHIVLKKADNILNKKGDYIKLLNELVDNNNISLLESVILMSDNI